MASKALGKGLGKGLGALIGSAENSTPQLSTVDKRGVVEVDINKVEPNKEQPRKYFDEAALKELASSIEEFGIIQPLIVKDEGSYYSIVAGERRWRAARLANATQVPVIIKDYTDLELIQIALIENIQRRDLNPIEEAICFQKLNKDYFFTYEDISSKVGRSRKTIGNYIKLLSLDSRVQNLIIEGRLSSAQGLNILLLKDKDEQYYFADKIIDEQIGLKEAKMIITKYIESHGKEKVTGTESKNEDVKLYYNIEKALNEILGTKVKIKENDKGRGKIEIDYFSPEELDRIIRLINGVQ